MKLSLVAAIGRNNELGKNNELIWRFKEDMKFFKETTINHDIIMGRKTFESLPGLLKERKHLVLSRSSLIIPEVIIYNDLKQFLEEYKNIDKEVFCIGGANLYSQMIEYASDLYLTEIDEEDNAADAYFPKFDKENYDSNILCNHIDEKTGISFKHVLYKRRTYGKR